MSGPTYVEFFQQLDQRIAIAITGVGGTLFVGISAALYRNVRTSFYLLLTACALAVIASVVTIVVSLPINERLATWNPAALPPGYEQYLHSWWQWHQVRLVTMGGATCLVFAAMLYHPQSC
jgi:uncharacterized membrane protein